MRKIREILRLKYEMGLSNRAIARACQVSNSTVGEYIAGAKQAGLAITQLITVKNIYTRVPRGKP